MNKNKLPISVCAAAASKTLRVHLSDIINTGDNSRKASETRYMVYGALEKLGYTHQEIADYFKIGREAVTKALGKLDGLLATYGDIRGEYQRLNALINLH
jgi:hypothetical protein